ncbi:Transcription initiation factor TFIID subunit 7 [Euphorbia peplus]|nr:Transcription initiation factor TFIID subunit 7 [Euphorbia peplus]
MEEQFILRVPPSVAERLDRLLSESAADSEEQSLDLSFNEDGRSGSFSIGNENFPASLLDLPCVVESYKTYDDCALVKTSDIGQMILVREAGDSAPDVVEYRHGLTPPMRDARKRRFRREPDLNPELVQRVERDLLNIMAGGTVENFDILLYCFSLFLILNEQEDDGDQNARNAGKKPLPAPAAKPNIQEVAANAEEPERSDSDESDDSI